MSETKFKVGQIVHPDQDNAAFAAVDADTRMRIVSARIINDRGTPVADYSAETLTTVRRDGYTWPVGTQWAFGDRDLVAVEGAPIVPERPFEKNAVDAVAGLKDNLRQLKELHERLSFILRDLDELTKE